MRAMAGFGGSRPLAPTAGARRSARRPDAELLASVGIAGSLIVAGGLVAAVNSASPFAHGSWLAAYLVLVGGVAQLALTAGPLLFPAPVSSRPLARAQLGLWNAGTAIVAIGVFTDASAVVSLGSLLVLAALGCFARGAGPAREPGAGRVIAYRLVIAVLAVSVAVGIVLSIASPGS
jgi:hypothetical protein